MSEVLLLYPDGYPLHIDVAQAEVAGAGTAMRFALPLRGHNLPLLHTREHKLAIALAGRLRIRSGASTLAVLQPGEGVLLPPGLAHRIAQDGAEPSVAGVVLWPGTVEQAFREIARETAASGFRQADAMALLARYGVEWNTGGHAAEEALPISSAGELIAALPRPLSASVAARWQPWLGSQ